MSLKSSFKVKYLGKAVDGLYMQLVENDKLYKSSNTGNGKFFSIVQSSGTGKSRAMIELRTKGVIVLYMNIRSKDDINGYPERDHLVADILQEFPPSQQEYSDRCYALFTVIFHVLKYTFKYYLPKISKDDELVNHWNENMCNLGSPARALFFQTVEAQFNKLWKKLGYTNPEAGQGRTNPPDIYTSIAALKGAAKAWNEFATGRFGWKPGSNHPRLVIEFDEAHTLIHLHGNKYRPSTVLCRAISEFSVFDVWVLFASTTPQVADFFAPAISHDSLRVPAGGELLFPPYVHLGWDQNAMDTTKVRPHEVSEFEYIARLGRPLWVSLKGRVSSENAVLNIACEKLCKNRSYNPTDRNQALAVLGARLCLAIRRGHLESNEFNTKAVASHMRILKSITANRLWQTTIYPSEPLLACAAAIQLHSTSESLEATLEVLSDNILDGMVETGNRGELVSRGLLLIGKDLFVRSLGLAGTSAKYIDDGKLPDCMSVSVVEYLRFMFGADIINDDEEEVLGGWNLNFSHWIPMSGEIWDDGQPLPARYDFAERHWYRTSAVQCSHNQPQVDKVIPIYKPDPSKTAPRFSYMLISDRAEQDSSQEELNDITYEKIFGYNSTEPYVVIMLDMGVATGGRAETLRPHDPNGPYRIYVPGMSADSFLFLRERPKVLEYFADIIRAEQTPPDTTSVVSQLAMKLGIGRTVADEHMLWDVEPEGYEEYHKAEGMADVWLGERA